jgi:hypothetical protein
MSPMSRSHQCACGALSFLETLVHFWIAKLFVRAALSRGMNARPMRPALLGYLLLASCSSSSGAPSAMGLDAGADMGTPDGATPLQDAGDASAECAPGPTVGDFPIDVGTVLQHKCQTCHKRPPVNHAPFPLVNYEDVVKPNPIVPHAGVPIWQVMSIAIQPGAVPHMPFGNAPQLTPAEKQTLDTWFAGCATPVPEGTGADRDTDAGASDSGGPAEASTDSGNSNDGGSADGAPDSASTGDASVDQ